MTPVKKFPLPTIPTGSSPSGSHYTDLFKNCGWKFNMRFIRGWKPVRTSAALLNGGAFHFAKATYYASGGSVEKARAALVLFWSKMAKEYESPEEYDLARVRLPAMISAWIAKFGTTDLQRYRFVEIEKEHRIPLAGGFGYTVRLDALVRDRADNLIVLETKTSSWRPELTEVEVHNGNQASAYIAAVSILFPKQPLSKIFLLPDIISWPKKSLRVGQITCYRGDFVQRDRDAVEEWKIGAANELAEISQKTAALATHSPYALFRRNTFYCTAYARPCEYLNICRTRVPEGHVPYGFRADTELPDLFPKSPAKGKAPR